MGDWAGVEQSCASGCVPWLVAVVSLCLLLRESSFVSRLHQPPFVFHPSPLFSPSRCQSSAFRGVDDAIISFHLHGTSAHPPPTFVTDSTSSPRCLPSLSSTLALAEVFRSWVELWTKAGWGNAAGTGRDEAKPKRHASLLLSRARVRECKAAVVACNLWVSPLFCFVIMTYLTFSLPSLSVLASSSTGGDEVRRCRRDVVRSACSSAVRVPIPLSLSYTSSPSSPCRRRTAC